jgi:hypothetical protein
MSIAAAALVVGVAATVLLAGTPATAAQTDVSVESLSVADHTTTVDGDVSDVQIQTTLGYNQSVPDATERVIKLRVGPSESELETLAFTRSTDAADGTGTVDLGGSLTDAGFTAEDFNPDTGETTETQVVVQAVIEVTRDGGTVERTTATDTATVTIQDGTTISVTIGGSGEFTVSTA